MSHAKQAPLQQQIDELREEVRMLRSGQLAALQATLTRIDGRLDAQGTMLAEHAKSINQLVRKTSTVAAGVDALLDHFGLPKPRDDDGSKGGGTPPAS